MDDLPFPDSAFDLVMWDVGGQASGAYFYRLEAGELTMTKKLLLIK
jgi:hypothetical protein